MTWYGEHPRLKDADDPADPVWQWFILNGHGDQFAWHRESAVMPKDLDLLRQFIAERTDNDPEFSAKARLVALRALSLDDPVLIRTGIQVLAVVGHGEDLSSVQALLRHSDSEVVKDVRCFSRERGPGACRPEDCGVAPPPA